MEFMTKREAEEAIADREERAQREDRAAKMYSELAEMGFPSNALAALCRRDAAQFREEGARIHALLPTLEE